MSITETPAAPAKPKRHARANKRKPAAAKPPSELAGLTASDCASGCNEARCAISGINVCVHPNKGGLHATMQTDQAVMRRFNEAKRIIGNRKLKTGAA